MFRPYQISLSEIQNLISNEEGYEKLVNKQEFDRFVRSIKAILDDRANNTRIVKNIANGSRLQELAFPSEYISTHFDVFISHSHNDENNKMLISDFASYLYGRYGIRCFIDSLYWNYCNNLIKEVNKKIGRQTHYTLKNDKSLSTSNANDFLYIASNIYTMLSIALMRMIDNIPCVIFVDSEESISCKLSSDGKICESTKSAWIYEEINYINSLKENKPTYYNPMLIEDTKHSSAGFTFNVDLGKFKELTPQFLSQLTQNNREKAMCEIFNEYKK